MAKSDLTERPSVFRPVPRTGVIYVTTEAQRAGFHPDDPAWCNLGQGQPETGPLDGAPQRVTEIEIGSLDQEYAPVAGIWEAREAVAGMYNDLFRRGMPSRYSAENVALSGGGRVSILRGSWRRASQLGRCAIADCLARSRCRRRPMATR